MELPDREIFVVEDLVLEALVWARTASLHLRHPIAQLHIELRIVDVTFHVVQARFKVCPSRLVEVPGIFRLGRRFACLLAKLLRAHWRAADPENFELRVHATFT
jgi:hypothetical protein